MKRVTAWECEICGRTYKLADDCMRCESSHDPRATVAVSAGECAACGGYTIVERDASGKIIAYACHNPWCDNRETIA